LLRKHEMIGKRLGMREGLETSFRFRDGFSREMLCTRSGDGHKCRDTLGRSEVISRSQENESRNLQVVVLDRSRRYDDAEIAKLRGSGSQ